MHRIVVAMCALMALVGTAFAGIDNAGTTAGNFLSAGTGPAILSMGGATLGAGSDLHAAAWNPAALAHVQGSELAIAHGGLADQLSQEWAAAGGRFGHGGTRWGVTGLYQGESGFDGRDALGQSTGAFGISSFALGLSVAQPVSEHLSVGLGTKFVSENLGSASGSAIAFDAGLQARTGDFGFGLAARNVGGKMKYDSGSYALPSNVGLGVAWQPAATGLRLALDANFPSAYYNDVRLGAEYRWQDRVALRTGYRMELGAADGEQTGGPTFGLGTGVNGLWLDYGYLAGANGAASQQRLGLSFHPGQLASAAAAVHPATEPAERAPRAEKPRTARAPRTEDETAPPVVSAPRPGKAKKAKAEPVAETPAPEKPAKAKKAKAESAAPAVAAPAAPAPGTPAWTLPANAGDGADPVVAPKEKKPAKRTLAPGRTVKATPQAKPVAPVASVEPVAPAPAPEANAATPSAPVTAAPAPKPAEPVKAEAPAKTEAPAKAEAAPAPVVRPDKIVVRAGETLADLAKRWDVSVTALMMENNLVSESVKPGKTLKLPPAGRR